MKAFEWIPRGDPAFVSLLESENDTSEDDFIAFVRYAAEKITEKIHVNGCCCIASFPADRLSFRNIRLPFRNVHKIRQILPFELEPQLPLPADELVMDFVIPPPAAGALADSGLDENAETSAVLATCVEKSLLLSVMEALEAAGLQPDRIIPGGVYPFSLALWPQEGKQRLLFAEMAGSFCHLCLINEGIPCFIRDFPIPDDPQKRIQAVRAGIRKTLLALENRPEMGVDELEGMVWIGDLPPGGNDTTSWNNERVKNIWTADLDYMMRSVQMPVVANAGRYEKMGRAFSLFLLYISGIKTMNLHKSAFDAGRIFAEHKKSLLTMGTLTVILLLLTFSHVYLTFRGLQQEIHQLDQQIKTVFTRTFPEVQTIVDPLQQMRVKVTERRREVALGGNPREQMPTIDILNEMSRRIPAGLDIQLSRLDISPDSMLLSGETDDFNSVDIIKNRLVSYQAFKNTKISSATTDKSGNRVRFKIKIDL
jgi:type II secretory pathway component PulL